MRLLTLSLLATFFGAVLPAPVPVDTEREPDGPIISVCGSLKMSSSDQAVRARTRLALSPYRAYGARTGLVEHGR
jgi:hypothetical protein